MNWFKACSCSLENRSRNKISTTISSDSESSDLDMLSCAALKHRKANNDNTSMMILPLSEEILLVLDYSMHTKTWRFPSARLLEMDQSQRSNTALLRCDWSISSNGALGKRQVFVCVL